MAAVTTLSPLPFLRFCDNSGNALVGGQLFTYQAGTSTPQATYTDSTGVTTNTNPVILNQRGECSVWLTPNVAYKFVLEDASGNVIWSQDQISNSQPTLYGGVDTGAANVYVLTFAANFTSYSDGILIWWVPANTNTGSSTVNVNGIGVVNITNLSGTPLIANQIIGGQATSMIYKGGAFRLMPTITSPLVLPGNTTLDGVTTIANGGTIGDTNGAPFAIGYLGVPSNVITGNYATVSADQGKVIEHNSVIAHTVTINDASFNYPVGTVIVISNSGANGNLTISIQTTPANLSWWPSGATGNRTLTAPGECNVRKIGAGTPGTWRIVGTNIS